MPKMKKAAAVGGGVIGGGWVARFLLAGLEVSVFDPAPDAEAKVAEIVSAAERAQARLWPGQALPPKGELRFCKSITEAVKDADLIQESVPERLPLKIETHQKIGEAAPPKAVIGSSTSGLLASDFQAESARADRVMVAHPFNPPYLLPVVELVGGERTSEEAIADALKAYSFIGMKPVRIRKEIEAFVGDRLLEAMWRESLWLVNDDIATIEEIDDIVRYGLGLRYAQMGQFMTYRLGGGDAGMRHFLGQFGPTLSWEWTKLMDVPEWNDELIEKIVAQSDEATKGLSIAELTQIRDDNIVDFLKALYRNDWGAGAVLKNPMEQTASQAIDLKSMKPDLTTYEGKVAEDWVDYNGHMTEHRYLEIFGKATDTLLMLIGGGVSYVASDNASHYTIETHIRHLSELSADEAIKAQTHLVDYDSKRIHLFHALYGEGGKLSATAEHMLIHVDMKKEQSAAMPDAMVKKLATIKDKQKDLPLPQGLGAQIGIRK